MLRGRRGLLDGAAPGLCATFTARGAGWPDGVTRPVPPFGAISAVFASPGTIAGTSSGFAGSGRLGPTDGPVTGTMAGAVV